MAAVAKRVVVHGLVQGVFFRESTRRVAVAEGVGGWVRNRSDGAVEALLEGDQAAVERVIDFMEQGPPGSRVDRHEVSSELSPAAETPFQIRS